METRQDYLIIEDMPKCPNDLKAIYNNRVKLVFPDGSEHIFRPNGYTDQFGDGYFNIRPDGWRTTCSGVHWGSPWVTVEPYVTTTMTYYSIDGSYLRLDVEHDSDNNYSNNPWTLYFPDGRRVTGGNAPQRIYDRNNNYVEIQKITYNSHPATKIIDQLNRYIIIENDVAANQDYIYRWGVGNEQLLWTVKWKYNYTYKLYMVSDDSTFPGASQYANVANYVVDQIISPAQGGSLTYTFNYNGSPTNPYPNYTNGWGELSSITLPAGAQAVYQYKYDGQNNIFAEDVVKNNPIQKDLTYQLEYDGSSTPVTETWNYFGTDYTTKRPDGGKYAEGFSGPALGWPPPNPDRWDHNLSLRTVFPDKMIERLWQPNTPFGSSIPINPYIKTEFTSIKDASGTYVKTAIKDYNYDKNGNVTRVVEYDWVPYSSIPRDGIGYPTGIPGGLTPKRVVVNTYYNPTPDASDTTTDDLEVYHKATSPNLKSAIALSEARSNFSSGSVLSRTESFYDNPSSTGNLTPQRNWDSTKGGISDPLTAGNSISVSHQYDPYGNRTWTTDANGVQTQFIYDPIRGAGFPMIRSHA